MNCILPRENHGKNLPRCGCGSVDLNGKTIAVIGYGIQGKVQAANARDSGCRVIIGTRSAEESPSRKQAAADGFDSMSIADATKKGRHLADRTGRPGPAADLQSRDRAKLARGTTLCFCHGFNVLYGAIKPPKNVNTVLYVPNAPGAFVREKYLKGEGVYGCVSVDHDATGDALKIVLAISKAVGSTRAGVVEMTFQHETEGDNFEEQILYGGAIHLMKACFNVMVENGYPPSFAYAKAIRSLRSVIDVMDENGIEEYCTNRCSRTAGFRDSHARSAGDQPRRNSQDLCRNGSRHLRPRLDCREFALGMPTLTRMRAPPPRATWKSRASRGESSLENRR